MVLHHIGMLTDDIEAAAARLRESFGYEAVSETIADPVQTALVRFLKLPSSKEYLELVCPDGENSKLSKALKKGVTLHHVCYQVRDIAAELGRLRSLGYLTLCEPVAAAAFPGRRIAWCMDASRNLVELLERGGDENAALFVKD